MPIFYKITKDNKISHLLGTVHLDDPDLLMVTQEIKQAFEQANCFVMETIVDDYVPNNDLAEWTERNQSKLGSLWTFNEITRISEFLDNALTCPQLFELLKSPPLQLFYGHILYKLTGAVLYTNSLDFQLYSRAKAMNKTLIGLEKAADLNATRDALHFDYAEQVEIFRYLLDGTKPGQIEQLKSTYLSGSTDYKLLDSSPSTPVYSRYLKTLIDDRDEIQANGMEDALLKGNAFVAIGAAHLSGVIRRLEAKGFSVEPVHIGPRLYEVAEMGLTYEQDGTNELLRAIHKSEARLQAVLAHPQYNPKQQTEPSKFDQCNALMGAIKNLRHTQSKHLDLLMEHPLFDPACFTQQDSYGNNALMLALFGNQLDVFTKIIKHPQLPVLCLVQRNSHDQSIFDMAKNYDHAKELFAHHPLALIMYELHNWSESQSFNFFSADPSVHFVKPLLSDKTPSLEKFHIQLTIHLQSLTAPIPRLVEINKHMKELITNQVESNRTIKSL